MGPGNLVFPCALSPDGQRIVAPGADDRLMIHATFGGGEAMPLAGSERGEWPVCWSGDGKSVHLYPRGKTSLTVDRIDVNRSSGGQAPSPVLVSRHVRKFIA